MKVKTKRKASRRFKVSQKGFSLLLIIVAIFVFLLFAGIVLRIILRQQSLVEQERVSAVRENNDSPSSVIDSNSLLGKLETRSYIFYYPKQFVENKLFPMATIYYARSDINKEYAKIGYGISLIVETQKSLNVTPNYEICNKLAVYLYNDVQTIKINKVDSLDLERVHGCEISASNSIDATSNGVRLRDEAVFRDRIQWYKTGDDFSIYRVRGSYFATEPKEVSEAIDLAVSKFTLK